MLDNEGREAELLRPSITHVFLCESPRCSLVRFYSRPEKHGAHDTFPALRNASRLQCTKFITPIEPSFAKRMDATCLVTGGAPFISSSNN